MLNMYWSWVFLTVILLLVQPSQALYIHQDIHHVARNQEATSASGFWLRALEPMRMVPSPALIATVVLAFILLILGAIGGFLWYRRKLSRGTDNSEKASPYDSKVKGDIEKGSKKGYKNPLSLSGAIKKPAPPFLPFIPKQPSILERIGNSRSSLFFPNPRFSTLSLNSRTLLSPPSPVHRVTMDRRPSTNGKEAPQPAGNPFVPSPNHVSANIRIIAPQEPAEPTNEPSGLSEKIRRQDPNRAERVRMLRMDLTDDFMEIESLTTSSQVMHLGEESLARLRGAKTAKSAKSGKSVRYMLPSSPRNPFLVAKSAAMGSPKTPSGPRTRPLFLSPKTARI